MQPSDSTSAPRAGRAGDLLALIAGLILPLAFAPFGDYVLAIVSQTVLYLCWLRASPRRALWRGWLYGLGMFGAGVSWVQISIHQFGLPVLAFSVSVTALFVAFMAVYPALAGWLVARGRRIPDGLRLSLLFPMAWVLLEWLRGWLFTGFPWLNLGYSQIDSVLAAYAPVAGVYGVSLAVALTAGGLGALLCRRPRALLPVAVLWAAAAAFARMSWTAAGPQPLRVALIQGGIEQSLKWDPSQKQATLDHYLALTDPYWGADLVVWPETAIPAFYDDVKPFIAALVRQARSRGTDMLIGTPYAEEGGGSGRYYNSVIALGRSAGRYDKRHLVPFGEYPPLRALLMPLLNNLKIPMSDFSAGAEQATILTAAGQKVGISICYEDAFGEEIIDALPQAALLVNVSNDAWFGDSIAPHQHLEMARMRALETGRYLLRATNNGITAIIDPRGRILARSPQFAAHSLAGTVQARAGATPYVRFGNRPIVTLLIIGLIATQWRRPPGTMPAPAFTP